LQRYYAGSSAVKGIGSVASTAAKVGASAVKVSLALDSSTMCMFEFLLEATRSNKIVSVGAYNVASTRLHFDL